MMNAYLLLSFVILTTFETDFRIFESNKDMSPTNRIQTLYFINVSL